MNELIEYITKVADGEIKRLENLAENVHRLLIIVKKERPKELKEELMSKLLDFERAFGSVEVLASLLFMFGEHKKAKEIRTRKDMIENFYIEEMYPLIEGIFINKEDYGEHVT